jgi:phosphate uptake regulator
MTDVAHETRKGFHQQLEDVQRDIVRLVAYVTEAIPKGTEALLTVDLDAAQELIDGDDVLDSLTIDHAVNIGERVRYMVTGWLPEHTGAARAAARRAGSGQEP